MSANLEAGLHAIGDPTRLAILRRIAVRPLAVAELARSFTVTRPAISQHLRILKDAGLVHAVTQGTQRIYHIDPPGIAALKAHFDALWTSVLANFKAAAEADETTIEDAAHVKRPPKRSNRKRS